MELNLHVSRNKLNFFEIGGVYEYKVIKDQLLPKKQESYPLKLQWHHINVQQETSGIF